MRAHQIMSRPVITVSPEATIVEAANIMLKHHVSGLPVVDAAGKLVGIVSKAISSAEVKPVPSVAAAAGSASFLDRVPLPATSSANMAARYRK